MEQEDQFRYTDLYENCTMLMDIPEVGLRMGDGCKWVSADHFTGMLTFEGWDPGKDQSDSGMTIIGKCSFRDAYIETSRRTEYLDESL